jgi:hypothetical protein
MGSRKLMTIATSDGRPEQQRAWAQCLTISNSMCPCRQMRSGPRHRMSLLLSSDFQRHLTPLPVLVEHRDHRCSAKTHSIKYPPPSYRRSCTIRSIQPWFFKPSLSPSSPGSSCSPSSRESRERPQCTQFVQQRLNRRRQYAKRLRRCLIYPKRLPQRHRVEGTSPCWCSAPLACVRQQWQAAPARLGATQAWLGRAPVAFLTLHKHIKIPPLLPCTASSTPQPNTIRSLTLAVHIYDEPGCDCIPFFLSFFVFFFLFLPVNHIFILLINSLTHQPPNLQPIPISRNCPVGSDTLAFQFLFPRDTAFSRRSILTHLELSISMPISLPNTIDVLQSISFHHRLACSLLSCSWKASSFYGLMALVHASMANVYWGLGCLIFFVVVFCFTLVPYSSFLVSRSGDWILFG